MTPSHGTSQDLSTKGAFDFATDRFVHARDLARELIRRDLRIRYKGSSLGVLWSLMNPLLQTLVFTFVFRAIVPLDIRNYPAFVLCGVLAFSWTSTALTSSARDIIDNRALVRRPGFPTAVLPMVTSAVSMIHFLLGLPILLMIVLANGGAINVSVLSIPFVMLLQFAMTLGLSYLIAGLNVRFRDIQHLVSVGTMLLLYLTPVFYSARHVPDKFRFVYDLNPIAHLLSNYRATLIDGAWPSLGSILYLTVLSSVLLAGGHYVFRKASLAFVDEL